MDSNNPASIEKPSQTYEVFESGVLQYSKYRVVISIDIGVTTSEILVALLNDDDGSRVLTSKPKCWPGQLVPSSQVPSLAWYTSNNEPAYLGAEAQTHQAKLEAEANHWELARNFKLHLCPSHVLAEYNVALEPLPCRVSLLQIYSDFLGYLRQHAKAAFEETVANGQSLWKFHEPTMEVIMSCPIGYTSREEELLRSAIVASGFTTVENAAKSIHFVTETEASAQFCMHHPHPTAPLTDGVNFIVCDAGYLNVGIRLCTVQTTSWSELRIGELNDPVYVPGGAFVDTEMMSKLYDLFKGAGRSRQEAGKYIIAATNEFERNVKQYFEGDSEYVRVQVGDTSCAIPELGVRRGVLKLPSSEVESIFNRCLKNIIDGIYQQIRTKSISFIFMTGGLGGSRYLLQKLRDEFNRLQIQVVSAATVGAKGLPEGALAWYLDKVMFARPVQFAYGIGANVPWDRTNPEHRGRAQFSRPSGAFVSGKWREVIQKGTKVDYDTVNRQSYTLEYEDFELELGDLDETFYEYSLDDHPSWLHDNSGNLLAGFRKSFSVVVNLDCMQDILRPSINTRGERYWMLNFNLCLLFGRKQPEGYLEWVDQQGEIKTTPMLFIRER